MRFYLGTSEELPAQWSQPAKLPVSGVEFNVVPRVLIPEGDITNVELVQVDPGERLALMVEVDDRRARRQLYMATAESIGSNLYLHINGQPMGYHVIEQPIQNGVIVPVWMEMSDEKLTEYVMELREATGQVRKIREWQESRGQMGL